MRMRFVIPLLMFALAGCGGGSKSDSRSAASWADGFCSSISAWKGSLSASVGSLQGGTFSADAVKSAVNDADDATTKLGGDLRSLGAPDTASGQRAKQLVGALAAQLETEVGTIAAAVRKASDAPGVLNAVTVGGNTLAKMRTQVTRTLLRLRRLDNGPLTNAFLQAGSCKRLFGTA